MYVAVGAEQVTDRLHNSNEVLVRTTAVNEGQMHVVALIKDSLLSSRAISISKALMQSSTKRKLKKN